MVQTSGSVTLEIGPGGDRRRIVLDGQVGNQIQVGFRAKDGDTEIAVGCFETVIDSVASALGAGTGFSEGFKNRLAELSGIEGLKDVAAQLLTAQLYVTDLALSATYIDEAAEYKFESGAFGFRVEFPQLILGPIKVVGFGVLFEYSVNKDGEAQGVLNSLPQT